MNFNIATALNKQTGLRSLNLTSSLSAHLFPHYVNGKIAEGNHKSSLNPHYKYKTRTIRSVSRQLQTSSSSHHHGAFGISKLFLLD